MRNPTWGVIAATLAVVGCAHQQPDQQPAQQVERWPGAPPGLWPGAPPGLSIARYEALPEYLVKAPPVVPPGNVGRWDARVPVAGRAWHPQPARLDALRLRLAQLDEVVVALRNRTPQVGQQPATTDSRPGPAPEASPAPVPEASPAPVPEASPAPVPEASPARVAVLAAQIRALVSDRPDLEAEADELATLAKVMQSGVPAQANEALRRVTELVDLLRIQLVATTE